ncbi:transcriptional regulator [Microbacterium lacticum]|nr:transcriptional regulator [Microbacterium lacticum]GGI68860.1 transcriptional regulator [Microbacterium lacticum]
MVSDVTTHAGSRRREQTRARLLAAAHEVFAEVGMDAASVEMICERAGFTRGAFYSNFASKNELFLALITQLAEAKLDEVAVRVRGLPADAVSDTRSLVRQVVGASLGERMEPQLISEIRTQALRDAMLAEAYLAWQGAMRSRVEGIIAHVVDAYGLRLRLPIDEAAQLLVDVSDDTCTRATIEGRGAAEIAEQMNSRLERLVGVLVENPPAGG